MANRFWVGGSATWDATAGTKWATTSGGGSGASAPTVADDVFLDGSSGSGTVTASSTTAARSINFTGFTGTFSHPASTTISIGDATAGATNIALKTVTGMTYTVGSTTTSIIGFTSTSATQQTVESGGKTLPRLQFNGAGGSWIFADNITMTSAQIDLQQGSLDTNNKTIVAGGITSSTSSTRSLNLGSSVLTLSVNGAGGMQIGNVTNLSFSAGTSSITISTSNTSTLLGDNLTYYDLDINYGNGSGNIACLGATISNNLVLRGGNQARLTFTDNITINGLLTLKSTIDVSTSVPFIGSSIAGTQRTFFVTSTPSISNVIVQDIVISGAGTPYATTNVGNGGNNGGMTLSSPRTLYWVNNGTTTYASTSTWSLSSGGASGEAPPLPQDTIVIDANSITSTGRTMTIGWQGIPTLDFSNVLNNPAVSFSNTNGHVVFYGDIILKTGMTSSGTTGLCCRGTTVDQNFDFKGIAMANGLSFMNKGTRTLRLLSDWVTTSSINVTNEGSTQAIGTFDTNGYNLTMGSFSSNNSNTRTVTMGSGTWTLTGNNAIIWQTAGVTNMTFNVGSAVVSNYSGSTGTRTFNPGSMSENSVPSFNVTAGTDTVVMVSTLFGSIDFTGFTGTFSNGTRTLFGSLTLSAGMTLQAGTSVTTFAATAGAKTITSNGQTMDFPVTFGSAASTATFKPTDTLTIGATRTLTLSQGIFDADGKNILCGNFNSSNANTRTLNMGTGTWTITGTGTVWTCSTITNLTLNAGTSNLVIADTSVTNKVVTPGTTQTYYDMTINAGGTGSVNVQNNVTFHTITVTGPKTVTWQGATKTLSGNLVLNGSAGNVITTNCSTGGGALAFFTIAGTATATYTSFQDITANAGASVWAVDNCTDNGNNHNIIFRQPTRLSVGGAG